MDLRAAVRGAHRRDRTLRTVEAILLAAGAGLCALALLTLAGWGGIGRPLALVVAVGCACVLCARAARARPEQTAAALDRSLELSGALATAFEVAKDERPLSQLLVRRVSASVDPGRLRAAVPGPSALAPAVALASAGLLLFALERKPAPGVPDPLAAGVQRISGLLAAGGSAAEGWPAPPPEVEQALRRLAGAVAASQHLEAEAAAAELGALLEQALPLASGPDAQRLRAAAAATDELRRTLPGPGSAPGAAGAAGRGEAPLRSAAPERRMSGSPAPATMPPVPPASVATPPAGAAASEPATGAGRFWPRSYDAVVAAWLEARAPRAR